MITNVNCKGISFKALNKNDKKYLMSLNNEPVDYKTTQGEHLQNLVKYANEYEEAASNYGKMEAKLKIKQAICEVNCANDLNKVLGIAQAKKTPPCMTYLIGKAFLRLKEGHSRLEFKKDPDGKLYV